LLLIGGAAAQAPDPRVSAAPQAAAEEPITAIPPPPDADPKKLALGERLFADPRLSGDGSRSCSSCHDIQTNGAGFRPRDATHDGAKLAFNTGTVFNASLSFRLGWEGRFRTLESAVEASLESPEIMAGRVDDVVARLTADRSTAAQFRAAYGHAPDRASLLDAVATYERSLVTPGSRFDRWLGGDATALSPAERDGYRLFKSLGCVSCHQGVNVGGNLFERVGVFHPLGPGRSEMLRVPSLRNVATTAPYFHNGSAPTLDAAVRGMAMAQLDRKLSDQQVDGIVAFLETLTGTYRGAPLVAVSP
jgi:cytochrome c peroxidase